MVKSKELSNDVKELVVKSFKDGVKKAELARRFGIPRTTICSIIKKFTLSGTVENKPRSGRKKKFGARCETALSRLVKSDRKGTLTDITNKFNDTCDTRFCTRTIRRKLFAQDYKRRAVSKRMVVKADNRKKRILWCRERRYWSVDDQWKNWIFSDECQVAIGSNNRVYIWRKDREVNNPHLMCTPSKKKVSVMVWGCLCFHGMGTLSAVNGNINAQKYLDILDENLWPVLARHFPDDNYIFMDDNAPVHRARLVKNYLEENSIKTTTWPAQSPDMNIIENIWLIIKRELETVSHLITTRDQLFSEIRRIWEEISVCLIHDLYDTIPSRLKEVLRMKGNLTKY